MQEENITEEFNIRHYWALVLKRRYLALSVALAVLSIFTWGSFLWPKSYEASSTVFIERNMLIDPLVKDTGVSESMEDRLRVLKNALTSRNIVERVVKKIDLDTKAKNDAQLEEMIKDIIKNLDVKIQTSRNKGSADLFEISYRGRDPKTVRDVVNTLVSEYIEENVGFKREDASDAYDFIQGQLAEYRKKLDDSDKAIQAYKEKNPNLDTSGEASAAVRTDMLDNARVGAEIKLKELLRKRDSLQKRLAEEGPFLKESPQVKLNVLNNQLIALSARYTDDFPEVRKVRGEIEDLKRQAADPKAQSSTIPNPVYQQLKQEMADADTEAESAKVRLDEISRRQKAAQGMLRHVPVEQEGWEKLQRDRNVYQKIYDDLMLKEESASVSKDLELADKAGNFRVVDPAVTPYLPSKPNTVLMIALGFVLGIAAGIGAVVGMDHFTHSFKDENSIERKFGLPVLATVPTVTTEADKVAARKLDIKVFAVAGAYLLFILLVLANEFLYRYMNMKAFTL